MYDDRFGNVTYNTNFQLHTDYTPWQNGLGSQLHLTMYISEILIKRSSSNL